MLDETIPNKELVIRWKKDHQEIVALAIKIIHEYEESKLDVLREDIHSLNELTSAHLMDEDLEFYKFSMLEDALDDEIQVLIEEFVATFEETKLALTNFLAKYTLPDAVYNNEFIHTFKQLVDILAKRISYEEQNLYKILQKNSTERKVLKKS